MPIPHSPPESSPKGPQVMWSIGLHNLVATHTTTQALQLILIADHSHILGCKVQAEATHFLDSLLGGVSLSGTDALQLGWI